MRKFSEKKIINKFCENVEFKKCNIFAKIHQKRQKFSEY